ncbi:MAG: cupin domain-containing protein, partial [Bacteroidia bacterium]|nr:cupin domain-containing protein [Bacteroidia bacterium]
MFFLTHCTSASGPEPEWAKKNNELIKQYDLRVRELSGLPEIKIASNLEPAKVKSVDSLASTILYPGVNVKIFWGSGIMVSTLQFDPNAKIPEEVLPADRFVFVLEGSVEQLVNGSPVTMTGQQREAPDGIHSATPRTDFIYLEKGSKNAVTAGASGAKLVELYSPLRSDYLKKAGIKDIPFEITDVKTTLEPNIKPNKVYDLYDIQLTELAAGASSRLISGKNMQLSFISMDPNSVFPPHIHPEEQMMLGLRGACNEILLDGEQPMKPGDVVRIPANMVHGAKIGDLGCDALDIFWPARPDYLEKEKARMAAYRAIIPEDAKLELVADGKKTPPADSGAGKPELNFSEGPKWMNGKIYFSNMYFDQNFNASPKKARQLNWIPMQLQ